MFVGQEFDDDVEFWGYIQGTYFKKAKLYFILGK
jgi:hypothetical protein